MFCKDLSNGIIDFSARRREHPEHLTILENHDKSSKIDVPKNLQLAVNRQLGYRQGDS